MGRNDTVAGSHGTPPDPRAACGCHPPSDSNLGVPRRGGKRGARGSMGGGGEGAGEGEGEGERRANRRTDGDSRAVPGRVPAVDAAGNGRGVGGRPATLRVASRRPDDPHPPLPLTAPRVGEWGRRGRGEWGKGREGGVAAGLAGRKGGSERAAERRSGVCPRTMPGPAAARSASGGASPTARYPPLPTTTIHHQLGSSRPSLGLQCGGRDREFLPPHLSTRPRRRATCVATRQQCTAKQRPWPPVYDCANVLA